MKKDIKSPDNTSSDYDEMLDYWTRVVALRGGTSSMRAGGTKYLPRFENESTTSYQERLEHSVFTDLFGDITESLADKPFSREVQIKGSTRMQSLVEDIDGQGNNLHNFAANWFGDSIEFGIEWLLVDYTRVNPETVDANGRLRRKSVLEERQSGARAYWVQIPPLEMIAVYSAVVDGKEVFTHCRMLESYKERAEYGETVVYQVREFNREPILDEEGNITGYQSATFLVWRQTDRPDPSGRKGATKQIWEVVDSGAIAIGIIPIVPLIIGKRKGNSWQINPAMRRVVDLQFEYYEQENGLKNIKKLTAFPMLSANGVTPETDEKGNIRQAPVGPRAVLYGGISESGPGSWDILEPAATSLTFLRSDLKELAKEMRELGRQPLTQSSGQLTTSTSDMAAVKGQSAIQRWALQLKDSLELAFRLTAMWMGETSEATVDVDTSFRLNSTGDDGFEKLLSMRKDGDLSQETLWEEARRRRLVGDEFTGERELKRLEDEMPEDPDDTDVIPEIMSPEEEDLNE